MTSILIVSAHALEHTPFALRAARVADLPPVANKVQVRGGVRLRRQETLKVSMALVRRHCLRAQAQASGHTMNVRVHRKGRAVEREEQDNRRRLRADAVKFC